MRAELAEEAANLRRRLGLIAGSQMRTIPVYLILIGLMGILLPWLKGRDFLDSIILGVYACLGVVFAAPAAAAPLENQPTLQQALARVAVSVFYGELLAATMLVLGLITVYVARGGRIVVGPDLGSLAQCAAFGLTLSLAVSTATVWLSLRISPRIAKGLVRLTFLGLLAAFYFRSGWLPSVALRSAGVALLASILFVLALRATLGTRDRSRA